MLSRNADFNQSADDDDEFILNVGPTRDEDPRDYSILRNDMPNREHVDAPEKQPRLTYSVVGWMGPCVCV